MGGGGTIVDGFRRLFHRRNGSTSNSHQSSVAGEGEEGSPDLEVIEDPDLVGLRAIRVPKRKMPLPVESHRKNSVEMEFFTEYGEASQYQIQEVIGKGSYGVVAAAVDTRTGERVAIKKINDVFEHVSDATRILREIKLLRLLRHPDIVEIKHIMLPPSRREFRDIYVVFELMESDLHQVIKANDDLTPEHHQFFLYQLLRALKYIHAANVFHRDLKPKNILANSDCKLKICDFGLARASFNDAPSAIFWTDYVATRWYRAPELCGSFFSKIRNEKARRYLSCMRKKHPVPFTQKFRNADPLALRLLERLLAFDPKDRPTAEEALADPYFASLANVEREPSRHPISKLEFEFERRKLAKDDVRELIYREILEYHPQMLEEYMQGGEQISFLYPSGVDRFKRQFAHLEEHYSKGERGSPLQRKHASLPRERVVVSKDGNNEQHIGDQERSADSVARTTVSPPRPEDVGQDGLQSSSLSSRSYLKSASISASKCVVVADKHPEDDEIPEEMEGVVDGLSEKVSRMHS
ncbi:mitogen-activated protein kinase 12 [Panicum miliaceum]|uniref:Mitogen-activated protein kinase 12 n=1 Tax=Panicum miliaceum TaxID=4540 RepID=A0A3L6S1F7_PANMI|nr:mitogen-activated protein kinase 12 [Panicum miliaceum]